MENKKSVIIIGGGSSVADLISKGLWDKIKDKEIWALNSCFKFMPYLPKKLLWVDLSFFKQFTNDLQKAQEQGAELICKAHPVYKTKMYESIRTFPTVNDLKNLTDGKLYCGQGGFCGLFALSLAIKEGYKDIYCLGYDFGPHPRTGKTHWYQDDFKKKGYQSSGVGVPSVYVQNGKPLDKIKCYDYYLQFLKDTTIYNVSSFSLIPYFPIISAEDFFAQI